MDINGLIRELHRRKAKAGTWKAVAESLHISQQHINDIIKSRRRPGPDLLLALGLERVVAYKFTKAATKETT